MSGGAIAGLIAAGAFSVLVLFGCYVLFKLGKIFDEAAARVRQTGLAIDEGTARVRQAGATVDEVNQALSHVNKELDRVDAITANVQTISTNISSLTSLFAATVGGPVVRVAAFSYGVRRAAAKRTHADIESRITAEIKADRATKRAARRAGSGASAAPAAGARGAGPESRSA
ncbi:MULTISPECIES: DUF948 domain-containing protein [Protofrankia]|uniref:Secreted protein n=1 Tax=Candidatus Protofrankia californiensis TaxID=1839754 RepID=A0A1C3P9N3_9ACTN|nr:MULTISPECIES: DUF948 domain-containing protein [Protofrankia]SBW26501.1 hypothetical protein FDG2_4947 [Candidatus Protofrankia californiensis]